MTRSSNQKIKSPSKPATVKPLFRKGEKVMVLAEARILGTKVGLDNNGAWCTAEIFGEIVSLPLQAIIGRKPLC